MPTRSRSSRRRRRRRRLRPSKRVARVLSVWRELLFVIRGPGDIVGLSTDRKYQIRLSRVEGECTSPVRVAARSCNDLRPHSLLLRCLVIVCSAAGCRGFRQRPVIAAILKGLEESTLRAPLSEELRTWMMCGARSSVQVLAKRSVSFICTEARQRYYLGTWPALPR